ncbi:uncharacterized protein Fot_07402 [Forsythia ovata]|uniref:Uncharacterized protein n=1 Tax=Forsythia ovata TaxID=205694 RepID=A0ABD1WVP7_9LAMI
MAGNQFTNERATNVASTCEVGNEPMSKTRVLKRLSPMVFGQNSNLVKQDARIGLQQVYEALIHGKERVVDGFLRHRLYKTSAFTERLNAFGETALMVAIKGGHGHIINKLVSLTPQELLALKDNSDDTALHAEALLDNVKAAQLLVNKNHELLNFSNKNERLPIKLAAIRGHREMTSYLFSVGMKDEIHSNLLKDADGERLMFYLVTA